MTFTSDRRQSNTNDQWPPVKNQHHSKGLGENQRIMLHDKTWLYDLDPPSCWKMVSERLIPENRLGGGPSRSFPHPFFLPFPILLSPPLRSSAPWTSYRIWKSFVSCPSEVRDGSLAENEFGALLSWQKATGGNHFEYSEYHVLQQNDQNLSLANMTVSDGVSL